MAAPTPFSITANSAGLTTASTAYVANDQLGTIITLANAAASSGGFGVITSVRLLDKAKVLGAVELLFFRATVTLAADNAAFDVSDADMDVDFLGSLIVPQGSDGTSNRVATLPSTWLDYDCAATSLFMALKTLTGHTFFGAVGDIEIRVNVLRY